MQSLNPGPSPRSPIYEVPYDVLREIFQHCLPRHPLETRQPNTTVAPMLLCQICSSWRTIALASPSLWSHLSLRITILHDDPRSQVVLQKDIDFIMWWKRNQGSMAPFLCLDIDIAGYANQEQELSLAEDGVAVLIKYVASAQYIQLDPILTRWDLSLDNHKIEGEIVLPNLHTLVVYWPEDDVGYVFYAVKALFKLVHTRTPSSLRRLAINNDGFLSKTIIPSQWSALTHLSMSNLTIALNFWFSLVCTVTDLQWAYIRFNGIKNIEQYPEPSAKYTLPQLSTLVITYNFKRGAYIEFPLTLIFSALYLPALHTLSLSSTTDSWGNNHAIHEIYTVLRSTPAITTLTLRRRGSLSSDDEDEFPFFPSTLASTNAMEPIWDHSPHLTHLRLELPDINGCSRGYWEGMLDIFVYDFLLSNRRRMALDNVACPIKSMTFITPKVSRGPCFEDVRDCTMASIQKCAAGMSNIVFKVVSHLEDDTGAEAWKEWGSRSPS